MNPTLPLCRSVFVALAVLLAASVLAAPPERTLTVDPVELIAGREVPGKAELVIEHEGIEYRFATPESKAAFEKDPAKYEAYEGGACGAMGALSGMGDARRYVVHEGRLFFFASDGCRATFLKEPAKRIERDNPVPTGTPERVAAGRATMDRMVKWAGGAEALRGLRTFRATAARKEIRDDKPVAVTTEVTIAFPDRYLEKNAWDERWYSTVRGPEGAVMASFQHQEVLARARQRAFDRMMARWPVVILKAYVDGVGKPDGAGLMVVGDGEGKVGEVDVEFVSVAMNGATSRLAVEKSSGRLVQLAFHGRDFTMSVGDSTRAYSKYATVGGITLPTAYALTFNGKTIERPGLAFDAFEVNPELPAELFKVAK